MKTKIMMFLLVCSISVYGQDFFSAPAQGMGNTGLALPSVYNLSMNPSALTKLNGPQAALAYQPHFITNDIQAQALFFAMPFRQRSAAGFSINNYGLKGTSSLLTARAVYVRAFGDVISTSISTNYHQYQVKGYGGDQTVSLDLGAHFTINEMLALGLLLRNVSLSDFDDTIDQHINKEAGVGLLYKLSKELFVAADVYYNTLRKIDPRFGIAYDMDGLFVIRAGFTAKPAQYFAGIGLTLGKLLCDISSSFHGRIGYAPQIALSYGF